MFKKDKITRYVLIELLSGRYYMFDIQGNFLDNFNNFRKFKQLDFRNGHQVLFKMEDVKFISEFTDFKKFNEQLKKYGYINDLEELTNQQTKGQSNE